MTATGTAVYTNPDDYRAGIGGASLDLVLTGYGDFKARLTWVPHLQLYRGQEKVPRIAYLSTGASSDVCFVSAYRSIAVSLEW